MSLVSGLHSGLVAGLQGGLNPGGSVGRDGPGNVLVPVSSADWAALVLPAPLYQWNCQDASGNLVSAIGSLALVPTGSNFVYQQTVAGWARKFVGLSAETGNGRFGTTSATLDAAAGQSVAWLVYMAVQGASTSTRAALQVSQAGINNIRVSATAYQHLHNNVSAATALAPSLTDVKAFIWYRNATTNASGLFYPGVHHAGTHDESAFTAGTTKGLGGNGVTAAIFRCGLAAVWMGADAETIAQAGTLTTLGWG